MGIFSPFSLKMLCLGVKTTENMTEIEYSSSFPILLWSFDNNDSGAHVPRGGA